MYYAVTHWILGVRVAFDGLVVNPCIPSDWPGFEVARQWRGATYKITVKNPKGIQKGVRSVELNGQAISGPIPPQPVGSVNEVVVEMG
jgi:N,N'-diacetylchitobiose phosphorylase